MTPGRHGQIWVLCAYYLGLALVVATTLIVSRRPAEAVFGLFLVVLAGLLPLLRLRLSDIDDAARISKTYPLAMDKIATTVEPAFPVYRIPPWPDDRVSIRFGCPPLADGYMAGFFRMLDPAGWSSLVETHALDISVKTIEFNDLFGAVRRGDVDVVIASGVAVDRAQYRDFLRVNREPDAPVAVLPALQHFNAYYLFARRRHLVEICAASGLPGPAALAKTLDANKSFHEAMSGPTQRKVMMEVLSQARVYVERGADLDFALVGFLESLRGAEGERAPVVNFANTLKESIRTTFEEFMHCLTPALYMGGIAQSAYLLNRCGPGGDYVVVAGPHDINFNNLNSFVCSRAFALEHQPDLRRLYDWWFDLLNRYRRQFIFGTAADRGKLADVILHGIRRDDRVDAASFVPADFRLADIDRLFTFLNGTTPEHIGTFMFPNMYAAVGAKHDILPKLHRNDAVIELLRALHTESSGSMGANGSGAAETRAQV